MGSDDLHHKRRKRNTSSLKRKGSKRASYDRVLIVCEGSKTEPNYFKEIRTDYRLTTANIDIMGKECGSDPLSVVNYAIQRFRKDSDYDRVYCVIDRDKHATFDAAIDKLRQIRHSKNTIIKEVISEPCFEYWLLLHFVYTTQQFIAPVNDSNCRLVISELQKKGRLPGYAKGNQDIFAATKEKLTVAIKRAKRICIHNKDTRTKNPSTNIHELVEYLINLNPPTI